MILQIIKIEMVFWEKKMTKLIYLRLIQKFNYITLFTVEFPKRILFHIRPRKKTLLKKKKQIQNLICLIQIKNNNTWLYYYIQCEINWFNCDLNINPAEL